MFDSVYARFVLRCVLFGVSAFLVSLQAASQAAGAGSSLNTGDLINALIAGGIAGIAYAGIGAAIPAVEPNVGNTRPS